MLILSRRRSAAAFFNMEFVMPDNESVKFNVEEERVDSLSLCRRRRYFVPRADAELRKQKGAASMARQQMTGEPVLECLEWKTRRCHRSSSATTARAARPSACVGAVQAQE